MSQPTKFITNGNLSIGITASGIQTISIAGKPITTTPTPGFPAQGLCASPVFPNTNPGPAQHTTFMQTSTSAIVTSTYATLQTVATYTLSGSILEIAYQITNHGVAPVTGLAIALPSFNIAGLGNNNLNGWDAGNLSVNQSASFHPGGWSQYAATWWQCSSAGVSIHCPSHFAKQAVVNNSSAGDMTLYIVDMITPGATLLVTVKINIVPPGTPDANVLAAYLADIQAFNSKPIVLTGAVQIVDSSQSVMTNTLQAPRDYRPWIQLVPGASSTTAPSDLALVTPDNPYGLNFRLDQPQGVQSLQAMIQPLAGLASGLMVWQPYWNPRNEAYRPDFDCLPPEIQAGLTSLFAWCKSVGLKCGMWVRANCLITPLNWTTDQVIPLDPNDAGQMAMLIARINNLVGMGVNCLGLDSVGGSISDYVLLTKLRAAFPTMQFYTEQVSDITMSLADVYREPASVMDGSTASMSALTWSILKLVQPNVGVMAKVNQPPYPTAQQYAALQMSPLVWVSSCQSQLPLVQAFNANLNANNSWK